MVDTVEALLRGEHRALSRLITLLERGDRAAARALEQSLTEADKAYCIGITGPPGAGKSTLIDGLTGLLRAQGHQVGILAVDPTSPYSGGALLGDRVRMQRHYLDPGIYIRSIATRGHTGGLSRTITGAVRLMAAAGKEYVIVETVGVGQTELGIMGVADTVVVVLVPESGDIIQTMKAGLMEVADIFVVNKGDLEGTTRMVSAIDSMLKLGSRQQDWVPPVLVTQAVSGKGLDSLLDTVAEHRQYLEQGNRLQERRASRRAAEFLATVEEELGRRLRQRVQQDPDLARMVHEVSRGEMDPYAAALKLLDEDGALVGRLLRTPDPRV